MNHRNQCFQGCEQSYESSAGEGGSKETLAEARRTTRPYPGEEGKKGREEKRGKTVPCRQSSLCQSPQRKEAGPAGEAEKLPLCWIAGGQKARAEKAEKRQAEARPLCLYLNIKKKRKVKKPKSFKCHSTNWTGSQIRQVNLCPTLQFKTGGCHAMLGLASVSPSVAT